MKDWIENRTGLLSASKEFLDDPLPRSVGWKNTLGATAGALFVGQIVSGVLMMLFYVPHPEAAYISIEYIEQEMRGGGLVRALHYWGASFMVTALFIHMIRVFFWGAYKKPREVTWLVGLATFGLVIGIAFTGQLLPWNQAGFWAAKVGIEIGSSAPVVGPLIKQFLLGGETLGALTLTRFYTLHVLLLPVGLSLLIALHIYLLRRHGPVTAPGEDTSETSPFYPFQLARDLVVISVVFAGLIAISIIKGAPAELPADPGDTSYIPRPEWYLMSHFEILRMTPGSLKILATAVLPGIFLLMLAALPWLDRAKSTAFSGRKYVLAAGTIVIAGIVGLTAVGNLRGDGNADAAAVAKDDTYDPVTAGALTFEEQECANCHKIDGEGQEVGPDLSAVGLRLKPDYMKKWIANPEDFKPGTMMPPAKINQQEMSELVTYLQTLEG